MTRTILLADDSVTIQKVVELTFMDEDFRVVSVGTGTEALERLPELRPQMVISDVHMPGADGYEVCEAARRLLPATPVLLLVGTFEVFDADRAAAAGASGHMKKPFDSQELLRRVRELLASPPPALPAPARAATQEAPRLGAPVEAPAWEPVPEPVAEWEPEPASGADWSLEAPLAAPEEAVVTAPQFDTRLPESPERSLPAAAPPPEPAAIVSRAAASPVRPGESALLGNGSPLTEADVDRIARRVVDLLGERIVREVAWEVVPDLAEVLLKARIRELEASVE
jgi:CheY-like chemotaxis protein